jgi:hypothetical protein
MGSKVFIRDPSDICSSVLLHCPVFLIQLGKSSHRNHKIFNALTDASGLHPAALLSQAKEKPQVVHGKWNFLGNIAGI